jgi:hypothetical protein
MLAPGLQSFMHSLFVSSIKLYSSSCAGEIKMVLRIPKVLNTSILFKKKDNVSVLAFYTHYIELCEVNL